MIQSRKRSNLSGLSELIQARLLLCLAPCHLMPHRLQLLLLSPSRLRCLLCLPRSLRLLLRPASHTNSTMFNTPCTRVGISERLMRRCNARCTASLPRLRSAHVRLNNRLTCRTTCCPSPSLSVCVSLPLCLVQCTTTHNTATRSGFKV
jgi:hypothetical protein